MWEAEKVVIDFDNVLLACSEVWVGRCRMQASLKPMAVELGNEDAAVEHFGPSEACTEKVGMADKDGGNLPSGTERADTLHEVNRGETVTVPYNDTGLGEEEDGGLADAYGRVKLDANDTSV